MSTEAHPKLTYDDLVDLPEPSGLQDLIDGELIVTPAPGRDHQAVVMRLAYRLHAYVEEHGGAVYPAPRDVYFDASNVVQPDIVFVSEARAERDEQPFVRGAPDIVIEVSSPSTRRLELILKRQLYARHGVPEHWYVDREAEEVYVDRLQGETYSDEITYRRGDILRSPLIPGFAIEIDYLLGPAA